MSGFGLGGFGTGFLQGFETMGNAFAQRGIMQAERRNQARADRKLQLDEELDRLREERAAREADSIIKQRDMETRGLEAKYPYIAPAAQAEVTGRELDNQVTTAKLPYVAPTAQAELEGKQLLNKGQDIENQGGQAKLPYVGQSAAETLKGQQLGNQDKGLEVGDKQRLADNRVKASEAWERLDRGEGTPDDVKRIYPMLGAITNPEHESDVATVFKTIQEAAKAGGDVEVFNRPEVMGPLNRTFGETINITRGMPITKDGRLVVGDSEVVKMIKHPTDNLIGFEVRVQPVPSPERQVEIEQELETAAPSRRRELEAELNPEPYQTALTNNRTPVAQGGTMRWFTPQEVQGMATGLKGISDFRAARPELVQKLSELKNRIDAGEIGSATDLDTQLKLKRDARADRKEQFDMDRAERSSRIETQKLNAANRQEARASYDVASKMIDDTYMVANAYGEMTLRPGAGEQMNAEKLAVAKILKHSPDLTGPEAYDMMKRRMVKKGVTDMAEAGVKDGTSSSKAEQFRALWEWWR